MTSVVVSALAMGFFGGAHCITMCGGVSSVLCSASASHRRGLSVHSLVYNLGRVTGYVLLGALVGGLGSLLRAFEALDILRFVLRTLAALAMLAVGLKLAGLPSMVQGFEAVGAPLWRRVAPLAERFLPVRKTSHALAIGLLWGLMPCGLLYAALALAASTESFAWGALTMASFGVATLPVMLMVGAMADGVRAGASRIWVRRLAGAVVFAFGAWSATGLASGLGSQDLLAAAACCPTH